jgi:hypothetical protein
MSQLAMVIAELRRPLQVNNVPLLDKNDPLPVNKASLQATNR